MTEITQWRRVKTSQPFLFIFFIFALSSFRCFVDFDVNITVNVSYSNQNEQVVQQLSKLH